MFTAPVLVAVALAIGISWLAVHEATERGGPRAVRVTQGLSVVTVALVAWCAWSVAGERTALAEADLAPGAAMDLPAYETAPMVMVRGELPHVASGQTASGSFELEVRTDEGLVGRYDGDLGETWRKGRAGRRGQTQTLIRHDEARIDLPAEAGAHPLHITLTKEEGELEGPLHVAVLRAPPTWPLVGGLGVLLAGAAAIADTIEGRKTRSSLWVALMGAFAVALLDGVTPHSSPMAIAGAGMLAVMTGLPAWLVIKGLVAALPFGRQQAEPAAT